MKKIAFLIVSHGVDGRDKETITSAFWNEQERDAAKKGKDSRLSTKDIIVDDVRDLAAAKAKLNPLELLLIVDEQRAIYDDER